MTAPSAHGDAALLEAWWRDSVLADPIGGDDVVALWFGVVELVRDEGPRWELYVAGCSAFDPRPRHDDWRTEIVWEPADAYVFLPALSAVPKTPMQAARLEHAIALVRGLAPERSWRASTLQGVGVGFDDGEANVVYARRLTPAAGT